MIPEKEVKRLGLTEEQIIELTMLTLGVDEMGARFIIGIESGDIPPAGDVIELGENDDTEAE